MIINSNSNQYVSIGLNKTTNINEKAKQIEKNELQDDNIKIKARNSYRSEIDKLVAMHKEYYGKINEQNKMFPNPYEHISDKYFSPISPYYIEGLTFEERQEGSYTEHSYLRLNEPVTTNFDNDPFFRGLGPVSAKLEIAERKAYNRQEVNSQFQELLNANNISIPKNTKFRFNIDPNDYKVTVEGMEDLKLKKILEELLKPDDAKQLFYHISLSESDGNAQFTKEKRDKYSLVSTIKNETGYNLRDLDIKDGKFVTEDGVDIFKIYEKNVREGTSIPEFAKDIAIGHYGEKLYELAQTGFDSVPDLVLSIDYENGSFYDVGQSENFGTGRTAWIENLKASFSQNDFIYG